MPRVCAYCGRDDRPLETEHVFPESWYPDGHPAAAMLTVPSCRDCNDGYNRIEQRLFVPLALTLPNDERLDSILERAIRSLDGKEAKSVTDAFHRDARAKKLMRQVRVLDPDQASETGMWSPRIPTSGTHTTLAGLQVRGALAIKYDPEDLTALAIKFLKGVHFFVRKLPIAAGTPITATAFNKDPRPLLAHMQNSPGYRVLGGWPFQIAAVFDPENPKAAVLFFVLWDFHALAASWGVSIPEA